MEDGAMRERRGAQAGRVLKEGERQDSQNLGLFALWNYTCGQAEGYDITDPAHGRPPREAQLRP